MNTSNERVWCTTQLAKFSFNHSNGRTHSWRFSTFYKISSDVFQLFIKLVVVFLCFSCFEEPPPPCATRTGRYSTAPFAYLYCGARIILLAFVHRDVYCSLFCDHGQLRKMSWCENIIIITLVLGEIWNFQFSSQIENTIVLLNNTRSIW